MSNPSCFSTRKSSTNGWWSMTSANQLPAQAPLTTTPVPPIQMLFTMPSFGQLNSYSLPCRGVSCSTPPYPQLIWALTHWCWFKEKQTPQAAGGWTWARVCRSGQEGKQRRETHQSACHQVFADPLPHSLPGLGPMPSCTVGSQRRKGRRQESLFCSS